MQKTIMLSHREILHAIRTWLSVPLWPVAGVALGYETPGATYAAAKRKRIPVIEDGGRRKRVATAWLRRVLAIDTAPPASPRRHRRRHKAA